VPRVGHVGDDLGGLVEQGIRSAVVLTPNLGFGELNRTVRRLRNLFDHVQVVTSLAGVAHTRLVPTPLVDETTFYLEGAVSSTWQRAAKRATDVVLASLLLLFSVPVMAGIALAIKITDRGPVLFGQERVGRGGGTITLWKFRSMVVDADKMLEQVRAEEGNDRSGPLFKAAHDPRITKVGRVLRASSLDELPQLWSIIVGDMSLVGPRPALPAEVADFDAAHRRRHEVRPGLTGLWQVEDRDHPDFERYRRHDVFYVENWSLSLDLAIMLQTAATVVSRAVRAVLGNTRTVGA
jgi:lipopolysaccharide/colanic/teichoic acid biosynthesis glycosyltransferase